MKLPTAREHDIQNMIINYLKYKGYFVIRHNSGMVENKYGGRIKLGEAGIPDIYALKDGQSYFLEVKRSKKHLATDIQNNKMEEIEAHGGVCYVVSSIEDLQEVGL